MNNDSSHLVGRWSIALGLCLLVVSAAAASNEWVSSYRPAAPRVEGGMLVAAQDGGFVALGHSAPSLGAGGDIILFKVDPFGALEWQKSFGGPGEEWAAGIVALDDGGFAFIGTTASFGAGGRDLWLVRLDAAGSLVWQRAYGTAQAESGVALVTAPGGGFYLLGSGGGSWLLHVDGFGNKLDEWLYGVGDPKSLVTVADGGVLILGDRYDCSVVCTDTYRNKFVLRIGAAGEILWQYRFPEGDRAFGAAVASTPDGGFAVLGYTGFPGGVSSVLKLDHAGALLWSQYFAVPSSGDTIGNSISVGPGGEILVSGFVDYLSGQFSNAFLVRLDADGDPIRSGVYGNAWNESAATAVEIPGGVLLSGTIQPVFPSTGRRAFWMATLDASGGNDSDCNIVGGPLSFQRTTPSRLVPNLAAVPFASQSTVTSAVAADAGVVRSGCFVDDDGDGAPNSTDNCPTIPNQDQFDSDGDGFGDRCDPCIYDPMNDQDGDGVCAPDDNCRTTANPDQADSDGDRIGDACDVCPSVPDPDQHDTDGDGRGDACDACPLDPGKTDSGICGCGVPDTDSDGDGTPNCLDGCPDDPDKIAPGLCGCGTAEVDNDGDGMPDCSDQDQCPGDPNKDSPGICGCGVPDTDSDGDGVADCHDNCPTIPNSDQADWNQDGIGDACNGCADADHDGFCDVIDACPNSILDPTVVIPPAGVAPPPPGTAPNTAVPCDSGVPNCLLADGCTIEDKIAACDAASSSKGQFDKCVKALLNQLKKQHVITEPERKAIDKCVKKYKKRNVHAGSSGGVHSGSGSTDH